MRGSGGACRTAAEDRCVQRTRKKRGDSERGFHSMVYTDFKARESLALGCAENRRTEAENMIHVTKSGDPAWTSG